MKNKTITEPVLKLADPNGKMKYSLWVLEAGQSCKISSAPCHSFQASKTASLIYEVSGGGTHSCVEHSLNDKSIWDWISEHMQKGINTLPVS